jgi:hypothetical protein
MAPLVCSLLLAVVCLSAVVLADNGLELVQVQVMHRHGAREALVGYNNTIVCGNVGNPYRCGELNEPGKLMLLQLGDLLHTRYTALLNFTDSYSQYVAYTRSTDLNRTVQSAAALLKGFFPNSSAYFPIVNTVTFATDLLLLVDAQMSFHIPALLNEMPGYSLPDSFFTMFTDSELRQMGRESFQEALCVLPSFNQTTIAACALTVQDVAAAWEATGRLPSAPTMLANFDKLNEMRRIHNTLLFVYDPSNPIMKSRGNLGYNLASTIASKMYQQAGLSPRGFLNTRFFHWSAHDTTYMPLASAIGMNNADFMRPCSARPSFSSSGATARQTNILCVSTTARRSSTPATTATTSRSSTRPAWTRTAMLFTARALRRSRWKPSRASSTAPRAQTSATRSAS